MMRIFRFALFASIISLMHVSCKKETPSEEIPDLNDRGVLIVNEGNFMWSNASVSSYNFIDGKYYEDIFDEVNNRPLGDVAQSITVSDGKAYIVVNNSNKIEIVDLKTFSSQGVITGLTSPRYFLPVTSYKAYVSDLYSNSISIIDLNHNTKTGNINCKGSTEEMLRAGNEIIVTNTRTDKIFIINATTDAITDSIQVGYASNSLCMDKDGKLWVFCAGDITGAINASIYKINLSARLVELSFQLSKPLNIWDKMRINPTNDTLYYMNYGIYRLSIHDSQLQSSPFIAQGSSLFHGLAVNPSTRNIFVADAVDYIQKGKVYYYNSSGVLSGTINTGVIPVEFYFY